MRVILCKNSRILKGQISDAINNANFSTIWRRSLIGGRIDAENALLNHLAYGDRFRLLILDYDVLWSCRLLVHVLYLLHDHWSLYSFVWQPFFTFHIYYYYFIPFISLKVVLLKFKFIKVSYFIQQCKRIINSSINFNNSTFKRDIIKGEVEYIK